MNAPSSRQLLPRRRVAIGPRRPQYLHEAELDRMMMVVTALAAEVSALRDRLDTHEALESKNIPATREAVEGYVLDDADVARREAGRAALLKRVYRVLTEELDAINQDAETTKPPAWQMPDEWKKT